LRWEILSGAFLISSRRRGCCTRKSGVVSIYHKMPSWAILIRNKNFG
jgi:hypothetical protein